MDQHEIDENEISLIDLVAIMLKRKKMIITITITAMIIVLGLSVLSLLIPPEKSFLPNEYTPKALMLINDSNSSGGGVSSMLNSSGLGGLANLAGVNVSSGSTYSQLAVYLATTNSFLDAVVDKFDLVNRYKIKEHVRTESRRALSEKLSANYDEDSGVFSISFEDYDPEFARDVVNFCTQNMEGRFSEMGLDKNKLQKENLEENIANTYDEIRRLEKESQKLAYSVSSGSNATSIPSIMLESTRIKREIEAQEQVYTQLKTQYELLKVAMASETPIFQVLELAEVPDKKSGPSRAQLCVIVTFTALFGSIMLVFLLNAISNLRNDPETMAKLRGR